jgi:peptidoglycan/xylan/chitin deacetylase (PgdA/CDA1 family)|nr:polysaccharide deacetylase family protein [Kofleriaceae bacterium]
MMRIAASAVAALLVGQLAAPAAAKGWPTPAAGDSTSGGPELILTFDDGPNLKTTPEVLDTLAKHHLHAIFFLVGNMADRKNKKIKPLFDRMIREGHILATHTMTHENLCRKKVTDEQAAAEIDDGKKTVDDIADIRTMWFRTPYGVRCDRVEKLLAERHLEHFHWDIDPQEWKHPEVDRAVKYVTGQLEKNSDRVVLLMHDVKVVTTKALPQILDWIDAENVKRLAVHKKPIRIVNGYELAAERLPQGLVSWLGSITPDWGGLSGAVAGDLP